MEKLSGCPFMSRTDRRRPTAALQLCGGAGSVLGPWLSALMAGPMCVCLRVLVGHSARAQWPWMEHANPHGPELDCHSSCAFLLPLHRFLQNSQSVGGMYTNLCLWFHRVTMKTSLKLAFMLVNILLPSKSHGVFM